MTAGIIEKGNSGLFNNEIEFKGKYATMARFLKDDAGLFQSLRDIYVIAPLVGFLNNRQETDDEGESVQPASIFPAEIIKRKTDLRLVYRLIMLLKDEPNYNLDDYKNRAFKEDVEEDESMIKSNMMIFNSYACGGIEFLYEKFKECDELGKTVDNLHKYLDSFCTDIGLKESNNTLPNYS